MKMSKRQTEERLRRKKFRENYWARKSEIKAQRKLKAMAQNPELLPIYYTINSITIED